MKPAVVIALVKTAVSSSWSSTCCVIRSRNGMLPLLLMTVRFACLKSDDFATLAERLLGGFEEPDDPQTGHAVVHRRAVVDDAVDEVIELGLERLGLLHLRRPHVAGPVAD